LAIKARQTTTTTPAWRQQVRRDGVTGGVGDRGRRTRHRLPGRHRDRGIRSGDRQLLECLVDRHGLGAEQDALQPVGRRVLTGDRR
jgi:hypothetical protein